MKRLTQQNSTYYEKAIKQLQEYENTGLTPQEVEIYVKCQGKLIDKELLKLRKENTELKSRLEKSVELPCKVGDIVYDISFGHINEYKIIAFDLYSEMKIAIYEIDYEDRFGLDFHEFGKTVFLTQEEAEQALKGGAKNA